MHGENQDGTGRVRHVPIQVESRAPKTNQGQSGNGHQARGHHHYGQQQQSYHHNHDPNAGTQYHHNPNFHVDSNQASSNTSSVTIDYKPSMPQRQSQSPNFASDNGQHNSTGHSQTIEQKRDNNTDHQVEPLATGRGQDKPCSDRASRGRHDKEPLVISPEPIPLPPPPPSSSTPDASSNARSSPSCNHSSNEQQPNTEQEQQQQADQITDNTKPKKKDTSALGLINSIKLDVTDLLQGITNFAGLSAKSKEYRYLDEMLTRCMISLDEIECGDSAELRQQRKSATKMVDQATVILQRKLQINIDIHDLSKSMAIS